MTAPDYGVIGPPAKKRVPFDIDLARWLEKVILVVLPDLLSQVRGVQMSGLLISK